MKLQIQDRIILLLCGLACILGAVAIVAEVFVVIGLTPLVVRLLTPQSLRGRILICALALLMLLVGIYLCSLMFRRSRTRNGFVEQRTEAGDLSISIKALETLVHKCVDPQEEIHVNAMHLENNRDGIEIYLRGTAPSGINIPLVVNHLQKQIKQYVTACSGVDVRSVCVQIDQTVESGNSSAYEVPTPGHTDVAIAEPIQPNHAKRPLHQRIFGKAEQPQLPPVPPELENAHEEGSEEKDVPKETDTSAFSEVETAAPPEEQTSDTPLEQPLEDAPSSCDAECDEDREAEADEVSEADDDNGNDAVELDHSPASSSDSLEGDTENADSATTRDEFYPMLPDEEHTDIDDGLSEAFLNELNDEPLDSLIDETEADEQPAAPSAGDEEEHDSEL